MPNLTLRNARTTIEDYIIDRLFLAYGVRLPAAATVAALRAAPSTGLASRVLRFCTAAGRTYQWKRYETSADDGDNYVKPNDVIAGNPGRWVKTASTVSTGYLKRCDLYNDDSGELDVFEQRLFGQVPSVLLSFEGTEHQPKSTEKGALYWAISTFTVFAVSVNERGEQTARQGSPIASEQASDPGTAAILGDVKASLAGVDLDLNDVAFIEIYEEAPVVRDLARSRFIESLTIKVYATLTNADTDLVTLADPYEFNLQRQLADTNESKDFDTSNYVVSGLTFPLGTGLTQTMASGSAVIAGTMTSIGAVTNTFGANTVTYRDVDTAGAITFSATSVGAAPPPVGFGRVRLGVTVTDASGVRLDRFLMGSLVDFGPVDKVESPRLSSLAITPTSASIAVSATQQFTATATFEDSSTADYSSIVDWSSGQTGVATVNVYGLATGIGGGSTNIQASHNGVSSNIATLTVT